MKPPKFNRGRRFLTATLLMVASLLLPRGASAAGLVTGHYQFTAHLSPVCLNGVYPFTIGEMTNGCTLAVTNDPTGRVAGQLDLRTLKAPATGKIALRKGRLLLTLATTDGHNKVKIQSRLQGARFVGTATTKLGKGSCSLDVSTVAPLDVTFDVTLTVGARGKVTGTGTATACGAQVLVKIKGSNKPTSCSLTVTGVGVKGFSWKGTGPPTDAGFTAAWSARGFGIKRKGAGLAIAVD